MTRAICLACAWSPLIAGASFAAPRIELDLVTEQGFPLTGQQQWARFLGEIEFDNLRIRQASGSEKVEVRREGTEQSPLYLVTGVLTRNNQLVLPGGRFSIRDKDALIEWKNRLLRGGAGGLEPKVRAAFGLTTEQFLAVHERLAAPVTAPTKDKSPKEVVREIARGLPGGVTIDPESLKAFDEAWAVPEELQGLSAGTALAAAIRPLGLVLVPRAVAENDVRLVITDVRKAPQSWPIGWPPEKNEKELAPKLYEFFTFEAPGNPITQAIAAIEAKLELPLLYDHNGMARQKIDLAKTTIKFPESRSYYRKVLSRILFEAKMKCELRVDEAGAPLLWISPVKN